MKSFKQIKAVEAKKIMDSTNCKILDVRTEEEFNEAHIYDAINIPLNVLDEKIEQILSDKDETILVYCKSGVKSKEAAFTMVKKGYTNVFEFGGIINWPFDIVL